VPDYWFDKPRTWYESDIPDNYGDLTPETCPECGGHIIYNGNYFCEFWGTTYQGKRLGGPCDWALPHPSVRPVDRELALRLCGSTD